LQRQRARWMASIAFVEAKESLQERKPRQPSEFQAPSR
jgi:hypothetical protein